MQTKKRRSWAAGLALLLIVMLMAASSGATDGELVRYGLSDVRVTYVFEDPERIDWPTVYYLNDNYGCRVDLITLFQRGSFRCVETEIIGRHIHRHECYLDARDTSSIKYLTDELFADRQPDIVIFADDCDSELSRQLREFLLAVPNDTTRLFNISKIYTTTDAAPDGSDSLGSVVLNRYELSNRYEARMKYEVPGLYEGYRPESGRGDHQAHYRAILNRLRTARPDVDFLSGMELLRLTTLIDNLIPDGPMRTTLRKQARDFISGFRASQTAVGQQRTNHILRGYRELRQLVAAASVAGNGARVEDFRAYLERLTARAEKASLRAAGIGWDGRISLRDSPHGPRLKFALTISVNGPREVVLSGISFHPYWDTSAVILDADEHTITPHQSYIREVLVDVARERLESNRPESLYFSANLTYGKIPLVLRRAMALRSQPSLEVRFDPGFHIVPPVSELDVDRLVSSTALGVVIEKPRDFGGTINLELETPRGVFAGAYRQEIDLSVGATRERVRIPFTVSNLMQSGLQRTIASLVHDGVTVSRDTAVLGIARCHIADTLTVGFLPDSTGLLEDVLRMTDAVYRPLTNRSLETADLSAYDVIVVGSGAYRSHPSLGRISDRFQDFIRWGGSLIVFGQDLDWPTAAVPFSVVPGSEELSLDNIVVRLADARILSRPNKISLTDFLESFQTRRLAAPAIVSPGERVLETPEGAALLSVSSLGTGQMIYCGLPLLEMVSELDIQAIHLLANVLNY